MFPFPTPLPFPSPRAIDLGVVRIEFNKQCVVFKRPDRDYPHVTQYFTRNPHRNVMWLHETVLRNGRRIHKGILDWDEASPLTFTEDLSGVLVPRMKSFLRPVSLEQMQDEEWVALVQGPGLWAACAKVLLDKRAVCLWRLGDVFGTPEGDELLESMCDHLVEPVDLKAPGNYPVMRVTGDTIDSGYLQAYRLAPGFHSWFFLPREWLSLDDSEFFKSLAPGLFDVLPKIFDALEIDLSTQN